jgi:hypothetical protein
MRASFPHSFDTRNSFDSNIRWALLKMEKEEGINDTRSSASHEVNDISFKSFMKGKGEASESLRMIFVP